jgi:hypothetical protein
VFANLPALPALAAHKFMLDFWQSQPRSIEQTNREKQHARPRNVAPRRRPSRSASRQNTNKTSCLGGRRYPLEIFLNLLKFFAAERIDFDPDGTPLEVSCAQNEVAWAPISLKPPP